MPLIFTAVPDKATGDIFTEQMWDTYIRDNINLSGNPPRASASTNVAQSIPNASAATVAATQVEDYDTDSMYTPGSNQLVVNTPGLWLITWLLYWAPAGGRREAQLTFYAPVGSFNATVAAVSGAGTNMFSSVQFRLVAGQAIYTVPLQDSGAPLNLNYYRLSATWLAP